MTVRLGNTVLAGTPEFKNYTTNRILEIPQNIKLELNNGTLTLKAGSKVYVPNGTDNFDVFTTTQDYTADTSAYSGFYAISVDRSTGNVTGVSTIQNCISGTTAPASPTTLQGWYDTTNNIVKRYSGGSEQTLVRFSFPLCSVTSDGTNITSIDQVFNEFGYIGSMMFVLPGLKVQSPNGYNSDGSYKNIIREISSVKIYNAGAWFTRNLKLISTGVVPTFEAQAIERFTYNKTFSSDVTTYSFDENTNLWWYSSNQSSWSPFYGNILGDLTVTSGKITAFNPITVVDSVVNSNMSNISNAGRSFISGIGMPGNSINITIAASGSSYIAPANGYFSAFYTSTSNSRALLVLQNTTRTINSGDHSYSNGTGICANIPVQKGDKVILAYDGGNFSYFKFIYAKGEN